MELVEETYKLAALLPRTEQFRLVDQTCRAAISIPLNIAEGFGRDSTQDYRRFLVIARASAQELDTCMEIARRLGYLSPEQCARSKSLFDEVSRMLSALRRSLASRQRSLPSSPSGLGPVA